MFLLPIVEDFYIKLKRNYKVHMIIVRQTFADNRREQYTLYGRNNRTVVVENNRPMWLARQVRHRMEWKHISGDIPYSSIMDEICQQITTHIKDLQRKGSL